MDPPTDTEKELIEKFRENLSDIKLTGEKNSDIYLLRWIRAREHKLKDAEEMIRKHFEWRKQFDIDGLNHWEPPDNMPVDFPFEIVGYDKIGCPVILIPFGKWDVRKGVENGEKNDLVRYIDQLFEVSEHLMNERSTPEKPVTQFLLLIDMANLSFWQLASRNAIETILEIVRRFEANHPETLHTAFCVNASRVFSMLFNIVKPWISPRTLAKVEIHRTNEEEWRQALLKHVQENQLPAYFGGTGYTAIKHYEKTQMKIDDFKTVTVNAGTTLELEYSIKIPGSKLCWKFKTEYSDIAFAIKMIDEDGEVTYVVPHKRVESQIRTICGKINCTSGGKYILKFDNSYGRKRPKTLHYNVTIVSPNLNYG